MSKHRCQESKPQRSPHILRHSVERPTSGKVRRGRRGIHGAPCGETPHLGGRVLSRHDVCSGPQAGRNNKYSRRIVSAVNHPMSSMCRSGLGRRWLLPKLTAKVLLTQRSSTHIGRHVAAWDFSLMAYLGCQTGQRFRRIQWQKN